MTNLQTKLITEHIALEKYAIYVLGFSVRVLIVKVECRPREFEFAGGVWRVFPSKARQGVHEGPPIVRGARLVARGRLGSVGLDVLGNGYNRLLQQKRLI